MLIDFGNTAIKLKVEPEGDTVRISSFRELTAIIERHSVGSLLVSDVAKQSNRLKEFCKERSICLTEVQVIQGFLGLHLAYADVSKLGVDRWLNMLAARHLYPGENLVVVDVGTALKIEFIRSDGSQIGGVIAPGLAMGRKSLSGDTALLPEVDLRFDGNLGVDTEGCIQYGIIMSAVSLVERSVSEAFTDAKILLTGGDAEAIVPHLSLQLEYVPDLLFAGMQQFLKNRKGSNSLL